MTKEELNNLVLKAKSTEIAKVSDLIEILTPFKDYYLDDTGCFYCGNSLKLLKLVRFKEHKLKLLNDLITIVEQNGMRKYLSEYLKNNKP